MQQTDVDRKFNRKDRHRLYFERIYDFNINLFAASWNLIIFLVNINEPNSKRNFLKHIFDKAYDFFNNCAKFKPTRTCPWLELLSIFGTRENNLMRFVAADTALP